MDRMSLGSAGSGPAPLLQVKSKFEAEFRRFHLDVESEKYDDLKNKVESLHHISSIDFIITYTEPSHGELLPINNDDNYANAVKACLHTLLRLYVHKKDNLNMINGFGQSTVRRKKGKKLPPTISFPEDFRPVSAIIDVDILPETLRRVRLHKHGSNKPLGFYIRDGMSLKLTTNGLEKVPGIFISRLVQGGLAEMTGLLAVDDEVLEVNHIEVAGKTLDQVTDMMVANSSNLIITVKPASMRNSVGQQQVAQRPTVSHVHEEDSDDDTDIVKDIPMATASPANQKYKSHDTPTKSSNHDSKNSSGRTSNNNKETGAGSQRTKLRDNNEPLTF